MRFDDNKLDRFIALIFLVVSLTMTFVALDATKKKVYAERYSEHLDKQLRLCEVGK